LFLNFLSNRIAFNVTAKKMNITSLKIHIRILKNAMQQIDDTINITVTYLKVKKYFAQNKMCIFDVDSRLVDST
jgi:hypothetical protein